MPQAYLSTDRTLAIRAAGYALPIVAFTILTALGAMVKIPLPGTPVPMTLQTFFVVLGGLMLGANRGAISQALYVAWGAVGAPLFAGGAAGAAILVGPTGGYLAGFIVAAWVCGWLGNRLQRGLDKSAPTRQGLAVGIFLVALLGGAIILGCGWLGLMAFVGHDPAKAFQLGVMPFIIDDLIKTLAVTGIYYTFIKKIKKSN